MAKDNCETIIRELFSYAGIKINGGNPWDITIHDQRFYSRILSEAALGLGEAYMDGWWDSQSIDEMTNKILRANLDEKVKGNFKIILGGLKARIFNLQKLKKVFQVAEKHYNLGNDLFRAMLDKRMIYSCGYWKNARNLEEAQEEKLALICKKINLHPGMKVLDIGCGWGGFIKYAAEKYRVQVVGVTVSKEQVELARELCAGLPVEVRLQDYRLIEGKYDRIVSIGMFEHVGYKNYRRFMIKVDQCLKDDGIALLHTIGGNKYESHENPWITKYIFPNGQIPSVCVIGKAVEGLFVLEDWHNFGPDYDKTLVQWCKNFENAWPKLKSTYGDRFYRMWKFYLLSCAGNFRSRGLQLWQIVMTKKGSQQPERIT